MKKSTDVVLFETGRALATVASGDLGNAVTSYYYFNLTRNLFKFFSLLYKIVATTLTLEATNDLETTADTDANWIDVTRLLTGGDTITSDGVMLQDTPAIFGRMRIKAVTTNATNSLKIFISKGN